ncbi:sulfatase-like hydrolase/transferase [uncultured Parabacteroides sp.]|uniref:sulfatase-like hydrolase/transferase n=1 Tax=uncultured Parabacteroides sp. TaxID=512312 RepID=UPI0025DD538F|nr:sulfatase-like hydrolase/transferase [uncultured Parabacteroides sp.]
MNKKLSLSCMTILSATVSCVANKEQVQRPDKPNVIFIYADDMGKGMVSAYGQKQFTTPNIDAMIARGTSFDRAYGCMLSAPARASLLTGYHDCRRDKWMITPGAKFIPPTDSLSLIPAIEKEMDDRDILLGEGDYYLPQVFKQAGYVTAEIGKLEWGFTATRKQMKAHGWDYYYGYLDHVRCHGFYPPFLFDNGEIVSISGNTHANCGKSIENETEAAYQERWNRNGKAVYSQDLFLDKMLSFIRENKDKPFFLFHPTQLPHGPVAIPAVHPELAENPDLTQIEKEYGSMVKMIDDQIGIIQAELKRLGLDKKTIIIFSADNGHETYYSQAGRCEKPYRNMKTGELFDDYENKYYSDLDGDIFNGNASMAGLKRSNLDGGVHIPLVFYGEGLIPQGQRRDDLVSSFDLLPTMAELLNISLPVQKDGISYLSTLLDGKKIAKGRYVVYGSNYGPGIVMNDGWKLRYYRKKGVYELYNLLDDPQERSNVIDRYPEKAEELKTILLKECNGDLENGVNRYG